MQLVHLLSTYILIQHIFSPFFPLEVLIPYAPLLVAHIVSQSVTMHLYSSDSFYLNIPIAAMIKFIFQ